MTWTLTTDLAYLGLAVPLTVVVATLLSRSGRVFLADALEGRPDLATAVNRLLLVGFYLLNLGFVSLYLRAGGTVVDARGLLEELSLKLGVVALVVGVLHVGNVAVLSTIRRRHQLDALRGAPLAPQARVAPPATSFAGR